MGREDPSMMGLSWRAEKEKSNRLSDCWGVFWEVLSNQLSIVALTDLLQWLLMEVSASLCTVLSRTSA